MQSTEGIIFSVCTHMKVYSTFFFAKTCLTFMADASTCNQFCNHIWQIAKYTSWSTQTRTLNKKEIIDSVNTFTLQGFKFGDFIHTYAYRAANKIHNYIIFLQYIKTSFWMCLFSLEYAILDTNGDIFDRLVIGFDWVVIYIKLACDKDHQCYLRSIL